MSDVFSVRELKEELIKFIVENKINKQALEASLTILKTGVIKEGEK